MRAPMLAVAVGVTVLTVVGCSDQPELERVAAERDVARSQVEQLQAERDDALDELADAEERITELEERLAERDEELAAREQELARLREEGGSADQPPAPLEFIDHGGRYWAVLWVDGATDADLGAVRQAIDDRWGPVWMDGDIGCQRGAAEALDVDDDARAVSVHFDTEDAASRFAEHADLSAPPTGFAQVTTYCLD